MGVPHLKRHLQPYAVTGSIINSRDVIVDGPALAYHVLHLCSRRDSGNGPLEQPSYALLGRTTVAWLDKLTACGCSM